MSWSHLSLTVRLPLMTSRLNNISKILGRLFLAWIQQYITTCANFNQFQSAYRPQYSTETALLYTLNNIYSSADRSQPTLLVSLDLSAAFDTIDHKILINRLSNSFGIFGFVLGWLTSYLSNRSQLVRVGQAQSNLTLGYHKVPFLAPYCFPFTPLP